jgi:hypothetical protein
MPIPISTLIPPAIQLVTGLIKAAKQANELSKESFEIFKAQIDKELSDIPEWDGL